MPASSSPPEAAIVGGGPAGLMAAEVLGRAGLKVTVYDRMPSVGRKLLMAGRGGLNLTHSEAFERFVTRYAEAEPQLRPLIEAFSPADLRAWCEGLGQETFVGSSGRVFPVAFKASPLLRAWLSRLEGLGIRFALRHRWQGWDETGALLLTDATGQAIRVEPDATILALGGGSWPRLGSDGGWVEILSRRGIAVSPLRPANMGFTCAWSEIMRSRFEGEPLKRVALGFEGATVRGEAIITADGIEGGAVYALSARLRDALAARGSAVLHIDLRPDLDHGALLRRLEAPRKGQSASTFLRKSAGLSPVGIALLREASPSLPGEPGSLARLIKAVPLTLTGTKTLERAISSAGGVPFCELDDSLMLKRMPGVFVAGEMLDWEAPTGGYLLQATFATGVAAAKGVLSFLKIPDAALTWNPRSATRHP
ncbi:BaiN/RdsA family NAD(P)/FAD-dependent oxidoreductase [Microvirga arsenatis]|uniref:TIGR03862 family flavoprotein n=1 Tax=Microvirga arsenatis TaxID=2692265 RepID=A0ABW9YUN0_9HYPH|nr:TIGR03862 family flavoprotein [Microvirga arsenatis]NBJ09619.1 TIGR03862 family flavoprotein [Microvirga arsenatis]NBJ23522.1 TIGR03862 family flavoprotein [Microvirga arsenatis]